MDPIQLYNAKTVSTLQWPQSDEALYARDFLEPLVTHGISSYIENIQAQMHILKIDQNILPVIVNDGHFKNSWVCSPYAHFILYPKYGVQLLQNKYAEGVLKKLIDFVDPVVRAGEIDSVVYVNNWLFAADLYPKGLTLDQVPRILDFLIQRFPRHAIVFRSLNPLLYKPLEDSLCKHGCDLIASRYVFITDAKNQVLYQNRNIKSDLKQWREESFEILTDPAHKEETLLFSDLYKKLYINSHSEINPQFNERYFDHLVDRKLLHFIRLKIQGNVEGIAGYFVRNGVMYCPLFGYDKTKEDHKKVYRLLNTALLLAAKERGALFHQSAGGSFFKKIRSAQGCVESFAVYSRHLPLKQRITWRAVKLIMNSLGIKYMKKY